MPGERKFARRTAGGEAEEIRQEKCLERCENRRYCRSHSTRPCRCLLRPDARFGAFTGVIDQHQALVEPYGLANAGRLPNVFPACISDDAPSALGREKIWSVERQNLNMRMRMRRFTRLTNAFSKKIDNHAHSLALYFLYYNLVRIHRPWKCPLQCGESD